MNKYQFSIIAKISASLLFTPRLKKRELHFYVKYGDYDEKNCFANSMIIVLRLPKDGI